MEKIINIGDIIYRVSSDDDYLKAMGDNFEPAMVDLFRSLIKVDDVVADIGANIGLTAILFSSLSRQVFAFEPSPSTYGILENNLSRAHIANVTPINLGFGNKTESLTITFSNNNRSGGYVSEKIKPQKGHITENIEIDTIDHYFKINEIAPNFIKIDVEGFELNVVKGGAAFLLKNRPVVVMEMNHFCLDVLQRITLPDFIDYMLSIFPCLYAVDTNNATIVDLHIPDQAYYVMHQHVVEHRFPNLVGGFDKTIKDKLDFLAITANEVLNRNSFITPPVHNTKGFISVSTCPETLLISETIEIAIKLSNNSNENWFGYGTQPVSLAYHWQESDGKYNIYDGTRTMLKNGKVEPGKLVSQKMKVSAPSKRGNFKLILTVVQDGICWFENMDFKCAVVDVLIC